MAAAEKQLQVLMGTHQLAFAVLWWLYGHWVCRCIKEDACCHCWHKQQGSNSSNSNSNIR